MKPTKQVYCKGSFFC